MQYQRPESGSSTIRAAQYVRMSTEHQQYSIENQSEAIARYADAHGMQIVRTYTDAGKSGLTFTHREGLQSLIHDVETAAADFKSILVYDVSRWGRFQDADESAYYEYRCKRANIDVHYCVEPFSNDGSISSALLKTIKRTMAAEYSRELSAKVFAGKCRLIEMGFRQGGHAGFGLRRLLIDKDGNPKHFLNNGERKSIFTDRVILVPGPSEEIEIVREIFRLYLEERLSPVAIADRLNERGILSEQGRPWTRYVICDLLSNPKYVGANVTNRTSCKLRTRVIRNPPEIWVQRENAFTPIIDRETFRKAREITRARNKRYSDEELLELLRDLLRRKGRLSNAAIEADPQTPGGKIYQDRFGGLLEAYKRIGYKPSASFDYVVPAKEIRRHRNRFMADMVQALTGAGVTATRNKRTGVFTINEEFTLAFYVARCLTDSHQEPWWLLRLKTRPKCDVTVIARLGIGNDCVLDYYIVPRIDHWASTSRVMEAENGFDRDVYRFDDLEVLKNLSRRASVNGAT